LGASTPEATPGVEAPKPGAVAPKQSLHMLARVKRPKSPNPKAKPEPPAPPRVFNNDVVALINAAYAPQPPLTVDKFKETKRRNNTFRQFSLPPVGGKYIQVYLYGSRNDPYEVALIFEYPSTEQSNLTPKIDLCMGSFAVGTRAQRAFSGAVGETPAGETAPAGPAPGVF
jgi:hypothetical protein